LDKVKALATEKTDVSKLITLNLTHIKRNDFTVTVLFFEEKKGCLSSLERKASKQSATMLACVSKESNYFSSLKTITVPP
jgi:hypothetical protein